MSLILWKRGATYILRCSDIEIYKMRRNENKKESINSKDKIDNENNKNIVFKIKQKTHEKYIQNQSKNNYLKTIRKSAIKSFKIKTKKILKKIKEKLSFWKIDFSFIFMFIFAFFMGEVTMFFTFVLFVILHELVHFLQAKKLGYLAKNIHLSFFGASLEGLDDFGIYDELKVILSAPLFNLSIVIFCYLCFWFYPESYNYLYEILIANLSIFIFNMLPIYPLDFGRIILVLFTKKFMRKTALKFTKIISFLFIVFLFFMFLTSLLFDYNFMLGLVCINLMNLLFKSSKSCSYKRELFVLHKAKLIRSGLLERNIYIGEQTPLYSLFKFIDDYHFVNFYFVSEDFKIKNSISELELYKSMGYF